MVLPDALERTLDWGWPDALWIAAERHADDTFTVWILDLDLRYNEYRCCLSVDGRWTVSPVGGPVWASRTTEIQKEMLPGWTNPPDEQRLRSIRTQTDT